MPDMSQVFSISYAALWALIVIHSLLLLGLVRIVAQLRDADRSASRLQRGRPAPAFSAFDIHGVPISNSGLAGRVTALLFVSPSCRSCSLTLQELEALRVKAQGSVVVICQADQDGCLGLAERYGLGMPLIADANYELSHLFEISSVPTAVLIDGQGNVASVGQPMRAEEVEDILSEHGVQPVFSEVGSDGNPS